MSSPNAIVQPYRVITRSLGVSRRSPADAITARDLERYLRLSNEKKEIPDKLTEKFNHYINDGDTLGYLSQEHIAKEFGAYLRNADAESLAKILDPETGILADHLERIGQGREEGLAQQLLKFAARKPEEGAAVKSLIHDSHPELLNLLKDKEKGLSIKSSGLEGLRRSSDYILKALVLAAEKSGLNDSIAETNQGLKRRQATQLTEDIVRSNTTVEELLVADSKKLDSLFLNDGVRMILRYTGGGSFIASPNIEGLNWKEFITTVSNLAITNANDNSELVGHVATALAAIEKHYAKEFQADGLNDDRKQELIQEYALLSKAIQGKGLIPQAIAAIIRDHAIAATQSAIYQEQIVKPNEDAYTKSALTKFLSATPGDLVPAILVSSGKINGVTPTSINTDGDSSSLVAIHRGLEAQSREAVDQIYYPMIEDPALAKSKQDRKAAERTIDSYSSIELKQPNKKNNDKNHWLVCNHTQPTRSITWTVNEEQLEAAFGQLLTDLKIDGLNSKELANRVLREDLFPVLNSVLKKCPLTVNAAKPHIQTFLKACLPKVETPSPLEDLAKLNDIEMIFDPHSSQGQRLAQLVENSPHTRGGARIVDILATGGDPSFGPLVTMLFAKDGQSNSIDRNRLIALLGLIKDQPDQNALLDYVLGKLNGTQHIAVFRQALDQLNISQLETTYNAVASEAYVGINLESMERELITLQGESSGRVARFFGSPEEFERTAEILKSVRSTIENKLETGDLTDIGSYTNLDGVDDQEKAFVSSLATRTDLPFTMQTHNQDIWDLILNYINSLLLSRHTIGLGSRKSTAA